MDYASLIVLTLLATFSGGMTRRAVGSAFIVSIGTIGGAIGGQIYYGKTKNEHEKGT